MGFGMSNTLGIEDVFQAVRSKNVASLRDILSADVKVNLNQVKRCGLQQPYSGSESYKDEHSPLMLACMLHDDLDLIGLLIEKGAEVDYQNSQGCSALMVAAEKEKVEVVKYLKKHGAQVNLKKSESAVAIGCRQGSIEIVKELLADFPKDEKPSARSIYNVGCQDQNVLQPIPQMPLIIAIQYKKIELVKWFLKSRTMVTADVLSDALLMAIEIHSSDIVKLLFDHGAQVNPTEDGKTSPLILASYYGDSEIVEMLLKKKGANIDYQNQKKTFALMVAVRKGNVKVVKKLLEAGANVNLKGEKQSTPLLTALAIPYHDISLKNKIDIVRLLTDTASGADVNVQDDWNTALGYAVNLRSSELILHLLDKGAFPNQPDRSGRYPLWNAINCDSPIPVVQRFLDAGADISLRDRNRAGQTLLMRTDDPNVALLLIDKGADVNQQNNDGAYALLNALNCSNYELAELLLQEGAKVDLYADNGETALSILQRDANSVSEH